MNGVNKSDNVVVNNSSDSFESDNNVNGDIDTTVTKAMRFYTRGRDYYHRYRKQDNENCHRLFSKSNQ